MHFVEMKHWKKKSYNDNKFKKENENVKRYKEMKCKKKKKMYWGKLKN